MRREVYARHIFKLAVDIEVLLRSVVEDELPPPPEQLRPIPELLRAWGASMADGREF